MLQFSTDQWIIILLVFLLGLFIGGFIFSGGGRKWKHRYNTEVDRREELERLHSEREKEWRERDSLRAAALKGDTNRDGVVDAQDRDRDRDGVPDRRDPDDRDPRV